MVSAISMSGSDLKLVLTLLFVMLLAAAFGDSEPELIANEHVERKLAFDAIPGSIHIDCGSAADDSIETGISRNISYLFKYYADEQGMTLRSFPRGTRNCYTLKPPDAKISKKYLVRAAFLYGNYDNLNQIPIFDLHIGVNKWTTVHLENSSDYSYYEIIYMSSTVHVDVCLVNTDSGVPFISELELRVLDDSMYEIDSASSLLYQGRYDAGRLEKDGVVKYPDDSYGRTWLPLKAADYPYWLPYHTTELIETDGEDNKNRVPEKVWTTAARTSNASASLEYNEFYDQDDGRQEYHFYFYFAEIENLQNGREREMTIYLNNKPTTNVTLDTYLAPVTIGPLKINATMSIEFSVNSVDRGQNLPPILNAFEILVLHELPNQPTNADDVAAMTDIKKIFSLTGNWQGDPCVPSNFSWEGVNCSVNNPPRIISLNLSSSNLTGELPVSLSKLTAIQILDLSNNELNGSLPEFLAELNELRVLNLSANNFTGSVPSDLRKKFKDTPELLSLDGNQLCQSDSCNKKKNYFVLPVVASTVSVLFLLIISCALAMFFRNKRPIRELSIPSRRGSFKSKNRPFSYSEIVSITDNFKTLIGEGGFGDVFHGVLTDKTQVAVKLLSKSSKQGSKEFRAEAQLLMIVHHRNLVSLVGYCDEDGHMGLIYEYMANGNLQQLLSGTEENVLNWRKRLQVAINSAQGLEYLHNGCKPPIVHRDLKPANILLDENMQAKIADFGLSRAFSADTESYMQTNPAGTFGYLDPECQATGTLNKKSDVYSFGIILFQIITGLPVIIKDSETHTHILHWVNQRIRSGDINEIVDLRLHGEFNSTAAWKVVEIAMSCVPSTAIQRPDMNHVLAELKEALQMEGRFGRAMSVESKKTTRSTDYSMGMDSMEFGEDMIPQAR